MGPGPASWRAAGRCANRAAPMAAGRGGGGGGREPGGGGRGLQRGGGERLPAGTRRLRAAVSASPPARGVLRSAGSGWGGQQRRGVGDGVRADPAAACPKSQPQNPRILGCGHPRVGVCSGLGRTELREARRWAWRCPEFLSFPRFPCLKPIYSTPTL